MRKVDWQTFAESCMQQGSKIMGMHFFLSGHRIADPHSHQLPPLGTQRKSMQFSYNDLLTMTLPLSIPNRLAQPGLGCFSSMQSLLLRPLRLSLLL